MKKLFTKGRIALLVIFSVLIIDQIIKVWIKTHMYWHESIRVTDWFYIYFTENNGMAFGMEIFGKLFHVSSAVYNNLEINDAQATKGCGLSALAAHLGIDVSQIMAFGDGENDQTMIEAAGFGVAMGNAVDSLKAAADYVTLTNDKDGVAAAIEKFIFNKEEA